MFDKIEYTKLNLKKSTLPKEASGDYNLPAITCTTQNNGIACYVPREKATIFKNCISVAANGDAPAFYQPHDFTILQDAYVLKFKGEELSDLHYLYFVSLLQKILTKFDWNNKSGWEKVKQEKIELPINEDGTIAFEFMENYIKELETERIKELEVYLQVTGLKNYTLSAKEKEALNAFEAAQNERERERVSGTPLKWREFKIGELFSVKSNPQLNKDSFEFTENGEYPYFTRTCLNNGINGYVNYLDEEHKIKGNGLAVGMLGMQFFYMQKDFYAGQFTKTCYPKFKRFNQKIAHFFITYLNKQQSQFQAVLVRDFEKTFNETKILLPILPSLRTSEADETIHNKSVDCHEFADTNAGLTSKSRNDDFLENQNGQIAFEFIENFISAVQKEVIKSVVLWSEKRLNAIKQVISKSL